VSNPQQTLSVVLTVHNAEKTLAAQVTRLLDVLPDVANRFELLIVDDGSTDQTEEVAHELARDFPQLTVARHAKRLGQEAAAQTARSRTTGEILLLHEPSVPAPNELRRVGETQRVLNVPEVTVPDPWRLLQEEVPPRPRAPGPTAAPASQPLVRGMRLIPRRTDASINFSSNPAGRPGSADRATALPRILARLMAQRPTVETSQTPGE
jgi:hypothetical protein